MNRISVRGSLTAILLIAALLRMCRLFYDLPFIYHPDEPLNVTIVQTMFRNWDLNPHFFGYPTLGYYINLAAYVPYYVAGNLVGLFHTPSDVVPLVRLTMGVTKAPLPSAVELGRVITVAFGVGTVALTYLLGRRLFARPAIGLLAALFVAIGPTNVALSRYITPDTLVTFFAVASALAATMVFQEGKIWQYALAGVLAGLTASTKYNGALVVLPLIAAHFLRHGANGWRHASLYVALSCCAAGFVAGSPFALWDFPIFLGFLQFEGRHYSSGHAGMEGDTFAWYLSYMEKTAGVAYLLATLEIIRGIRSRSKELILLSSFPVAYFVFICAFMVRNDRTFLPLTPFMFLLAASFLYYAWSRAKTVQQPALRRSLGAAVLIIWFGAAAQAAVVTLNETARLATVDSRETARMWIAANLQRGSRIAIEAYSPFVEPNEFDVRGVTRMIDHDPDWYEQNAFDYLVFSQGMYGRFYQDPTRYPKEMSQYDAFFNRFALIKRFDDGGYEVRIYRIPDKRGLLLAPRASP